MRPPNARAKLSSIPPLPDIRKSSPIRPIPGRSSFSRILRSATTARAPRITKRPGRISKVWRCANSPASRATGGRMKRRGIFSAKSGIPVISDLDTRALVRHLRSGGVMRGVLSAMEKDAAKLVAKSPLDSVHGRARSGQPGHRRRSGTSGPIGRALFAFRSDRTARRRRRGSTWSRTISASSATSCAAWCMRAAG